jgi:Bacterial regulatory helix-turn-helix protein, lysR family
MSRLEEAEVFVHVVKAGSFTAAASELAVTKSSFAGMRILGVGDGCSTGSTRRSTCPIATSR